MIGRKNRVIFISHIESMCVILDYRNTTNAKGSIEIEELIVVG